MNKQQKAFTALTMINPVELVITSGSIMPLTIKDAYTITSATITSNANPKLRMVNLDNFVIFIFIIQFIKLLFIKVTENFSQNQINHLNICTLTNTMK